MKYSKNQKFRKSKTHSTAVITATRNGSILGISGRALLQMASPTDKANKTRGTSGDRTKAGV